MTGRNGKIALWITFIALTAAVALPSVALGQGRGRGRGNSGDKCDKFINCHDARDGRVDGRGPRTDRDDDDYDDDDYSRSRRSRNRRNDDDYYRNGGSNRDDIARQAIDYGYREGFRAGRDDRRDGRGYSYDDHNTYRDATAGYRSVYGDRDLYRRYFQEGYRRGYDDGYRNRSASGSGRSRVRDILGDILGRP
ncbi:MAG TPA: hypothetical protein VF544_13295 [Pyrinomonadaceae bacterium]|jgi:hypothetical protein